MFAAGLQEVFHIWACEHLQQTYSKLHDKNLHDESVYSSIPPAIVQQ